MVDLRVVLRVVRFRCERKERKRETKRVSETKDKEERDFR